MTSCTGSGAVALPSVNEASVVIGCITDSTPTSGSSEYDYTCMHANGSTCRDGLPFFSKIHNEMTASMCFNFCLSRGLDLFGVLSNRECRCGASLINKGVWGDAEPRGPLRFSTSALEACSAVKKLKIHRFTGSFEAGMPAIAHNALYYDVEEVTYIESIVEGKDVHEEPSDTGLPPASSSGKAPSFPRSCVDSDGCGPGRAWTDRTSEAPKGVESVKKWADWVKIKYKFASNIDSTRKEVFRDAVAHWAEKTCIILVEEKDPSKPYVKVTKDGDGCYVYGLGMHHQSELNMGWCKSQRHLGSIIHEIGHVAGMGHEQKRVDATETFYGHGPFLNIKWQTLDSRWIPQWKPDTTAYMGSANDGANDPHIGYANYDYDSIMHYGCGDTCEKADPNVPGKIGQRKELSPGDMHQIYDMYQCKESHLRAVFQGLIDGAGHIGLGPLACILIASVFH